MKRLIKTSVSILLVTLSASLAAPAMAADCQNWPDWSKFRSSFVSEGGRVVDPSTPDGQTTSEGQSYGLFFSLVANDAASFARILQWTENNLAAGDLTARLPAWQWGKKDDGSWGVLDSNSAADADLWLAYSLTEAGRLWKNPKYSALGELLAERIVREESLQIPGMGLTLLPGAQGFHPQEDMVRLNPSYLPVQLLRRMAALHPKSEWTQLATSAGEIMVRASPHGFAPDWVRYKTKQGFQADSDSKSIGSFDAIRVYLWAGMLADNEPMRNVFIKTFAPMVHQVEVSGVPPLEIDSQKGTANGVGSAGFSAALLPLLMASNKPELARQQRLRIEAQSPMSRVDNYYEQALTLFGMGWFEHRYHFASDGTLLTWQSCTAN